MRFNGDASRFIATRADSKFIALFDVNSSMALKAIDSMACVSNLGWIENSSIFVSF